MKNLSVKRIAFIAIFSALTSILYLYVKFNLPIFPSFLDINISMIPVLICSFMLGPIDGGICVIVRCIIKLLAGMSGTAGVGELADLIIGLPTAIFAGFMYNYTKFKRKELYAFLGSILLWVILAVLSNWLINIPFYLNAYFGGNMDPLVGMTQPAISIITFNSVTLNNDNFMILYLVLGVIPFNLFVASIVSFITFLVHKRLRVVYNQFGMNHKKHNNIE